MWWINILENDDKDIELYGDSNSDKIVRKIFKALKIIGIIFFIWMITYCRYTYIQEDFERNVKFTTNFDTGVVENSLRYTFYDKSYDKNFNLTEFDENTEIKIKEIKITRTNFFNKTKTIFNKTNPSVNSERIYFNLNPLFTKDVKVEVAYLDNGVIVNSLHIYKPYFEFGIYRFWSWYDVFIHSTPLPLIKIGELD